MNATTIVGYAADAAVYCPSCIADRYFGRATAADLPADVNDSEGNPITPIFAAESAEAPGNHCDSCGEFIDQPLYPAEHTLEHPTLTVDYDGAGRPNVSECDEHDLIDGSWVEYDTRGTMDQSTCDCCRMPTSFGYHNLDGGVLYCLECVTVV